MGRAGLIPGSLPPPWPLGAELPSSFTPCCLSSGNFTPPSSAQGLARTFWALHFLLCDPLVWLVLPSPAASQVPQALIMHLLLLQVHSFGFPSASLIQHVRPPDHFLSESARLNLEGAASFRSPWAFAHAPCNPFCPGHVTGTHPFLAIPAGSILLSTRGFLSWLL